VLRTFSFAGARSATGLLKALALLRDAKASGAGRRRLPTDLPTGFIRKGWRPFVIGPDGAPDAKAWEVCVLFELRDRLRAGDVWVAGSRRFRSFEETLIPPASFAALRAEGASFASAEAIHAGRMSSGNVHVNRAVRSLLCRDP
jgi:hypothetical protein